MNYKVSLLLGYSCILPVMAANPAPTVAPAAAVAYPGKGLAQHDFFYAGEAKDRQAYIVKDGKVVWTYEDPKGRGEISDAVLLANGNVLLAHQFAVTLISPEKKVLWSFDAPEGTEIHTAVPIGLDHVLFIQNGNPAVVKVVNITNGKTVKEFPLVSGNPGHVHGEFRHARLTRDGTLLVAHMDMNDMVVEYDSNGKQLRSYPCTAPWSATPLKNGNVLIVDRSGVHEFTHDKKVVWEFAPSELPAYRLTNLQLASRLPNGNTLINNWANQWDGAVDPNNPPVQALELTPDKKVVWALHSWKDPNLGPATTIQLLDEPDAPENVTFGDIK